MPAISPSTTRNKHTLHQSVSGHRNAHSFVHSPVTGLPLSAAGVLVLGFGLGFLRVPCIGRSSSGTLVPGGGRPVELGLAIEAHEGWPALLLVRQDAATRLSVLQEILLALAPDGEAVDAQLAHVNRQRLVVGRRLVGLRLGRKVARGL